MCPCGSDDLAEPAAQAAVYGPLRNGLVRAARIGGGSMGRSGTPTTQGRSLAPAGQGLAGYYPYAYPNPFPFDRVTVETLPVVLSPSVWGTREGLARLWALDRKRFRDFILNLKLSDAMRYNQIVNAEWFKPYAWYAGQAEQTPSAGGTPYVPMVLAFAAGAIFWATIMGKKRR